MEHAAVIRHFRAAPSWRRVAIALGVVAGVELAVIAIVGAFLLARPVSSTVKHVAAERAAAAHRAVVRPAASASAARPRISAKKSKASSSKAKGSTVAPALIGAGTPKLPRSRTAVLVLNGIGAPGAAGRAADAVRAKGYAIGGVTNARRMDYTRTTIMYRPGFRAEAARLGRDMRVPLVGPLDGMRPADLGPAQLVVIVGR